MAKLAVAAGAVAGLAVGFVAAQYLASPEPGAVESPQVRDIVAVPVMSDTAATAHREDHYARITSIEDVLALPSDFAQSEALYALAGRSSADQLQKLVFDADRIADELDRQGALFILFSRLAEVDPASALAVARTPSFEHDNRLRESVWRSWARSDLESALAAAAALGDRGERALAATSIYAAHGYLGNAATDRIEAVLGVAPDRATRNRFLHSLISRSPEGAIAWVDSLSGGKVKDGYISWLAYEMSSREGSAASQYARLLSQERDSRRYLEYVDQRVAVANPRETIERLLATNIAGNAKAFASLQYAVAQLAADDLDTAIDYFEQASSPEAKSFIGNVIAREYAARNPEDALAWALAVDAEGTLTLSVLSAIAEFDPSLAIANAQDLPDERRAAAAVSNLMMQLMRRSPAEAVKYVSMLPEGEQRMRFQMEATERWVLTDPAGALNWILSQEIEVRERLLGSMGDRLVEADLDAAIRTLPSVAPRSQPYWRQRIMERLAHDRSAEEAEAFLHRFRGMPDYEALNTTYTKASIGRVAHDNPRQAAAMLQSIPDDRERAEAASQLVDVWRQHDDRGVERWVSDLPPGPERDMSIGRLAWYWRDPTQQQLNLIETMADERMRYRVQHQLVSNVASVDPAGARRLLDDMDMPPDARTRLESELERRMSGGR
ncbi:MAG: hypothetical protein AAFN78_17510 [Pseudomonadota bacterium]